MLTLIVSTFGATRHYPDQEMMRRTLRGFFESLNRQTRKEFMLFLACHDIPEGFDYPFVNWCSMQTDPECQKTMYWEKPPELITDDGVIRTGDYDSKITDMSRKTYRSIVRAGRWAWENKIKEFWLLRMDSDDLLAKDMIRTLQELDEHGIEAVFNRRCHMYDPKTKEIGEHLYPYSTTCNALRMKFEGNYLPRWYFHCHDHSKFMSRVKNENIPCREIDWSLCIITNSGNSISERPTLRDHVHTRPIPLTEELIDRYGLDRF
jgi:hypothetical protein